MVWRLAVLLAFLFALASGCTTTITLDLEVDRPLAVTIDGDGGDS